MKPIKKKKQNEKTCPMLYVPNIEFVKSVILNIYFIPKISQSLSICVFNIFL